MGVTLGAARYHSCGGKGPLEVCRHRLPDVRTIFEDMFPRGRNGVLAYAMEESSWHRQMLKNVKSSIRTCDKYK